jgi:hypothetical protein
MAKKIMLWGGIAFILLFIITNPNDAADMAKALWSGLTNMFRGLGDFISELVR